MSYEAALNKAWIDLKTLAPEETFIIRFLNDSYKVDLKNKRVVSLARGIPAKNPYSILILHYLEKKSRGLPEITGKWISFKELPGGQAYFPSFKKRVLDTVTRKYTPRPEALKELTNPFRVKSVDTADISIVLDTFDEVPILITFWKEDEEFGPEANVLFDSSIREVFCTEDTVVLSEIAAHSI